MNRRSFLKQVAVTAAVGAVAPQVLAERVTHRSPWISGGSGASRVVVGGTQYAVALDMTNWKWIMVPILKARPLTKKYSELTFAHRQIFSDSVLKQVGMDGDLPVDNQTESDVT